MMTQAKTTVRLAALLLLAGLGVPAAAQQGTVEVQTLEPLDPDESRGDVTVRPLQPLDEAEEGGFVRLPAPETPEASESDLFSEGFDEDAFGEGAEGEGARTAAPASPEASGVPQGEITEDGLWAPDDDSLFGSRDQSGSGWMEPSNRSAGFGSEGEDTAALLEEEADDGEPRFLLAPPTGNGLFGPNRPRPLPQTATAPAGGAELRELDKMTGATRTLTMEAGEERQVGRLRVRLEGCHTPQQGGAQGTRAFLRIWDPERDEQEPVFSGWMFAESPALSALDHPRYDLWVLGCTAVEAAGAEEGEDSKG